MHQFREQELTAAYIGLEQTESSEYHRIRLGQVQLVYVTPESSVDNDYHRKMLHEDTVCENLVVIVDEAHCIKRHSWLIDII